MAPECTCLKPSDIFTLYTGFFYAHIFGFSLLPSSSLYLPMHCSSLYSSIYGPLGLSPLNQFFTISFSISPSLSPSFSHSNSLVLLSLSHFLSLPSKAPSLFLHPFSNFLLPLSGGWLKTPGHEWLILRSLVEKRMQREKSNFHSM